MKHSRKVFALIMTVAMVFTMAFATVGVSAASTSGKVGAVKWNSKNKTVSFDVTVNKKFMKGAPVSHFIINDKSKLGKTAQAGNGLFTTKANALDLYKALVKAGATPWVDTYAEDAVASFEGSILDNAKLGNQAYSKLTMSFKNKKTNKTYKPEKLVKYKNAGKAAKAPIEMCFTGNYSNQAAWNTGCVACIFSCYAGVTSNQAIAIGSTNKEQNYFYASKLLKKGQKYTVTYKIKPNDRGYNYITAGEFNKTMDKYTLLDVRPADKFKAGYIKGAVQASFVDAKDTDEAGNAALKAAIEKLGKDHKFVLCCNSGNAYAEAATKVLVNLGVKKANIKTLVGGYNNWVKFFPVEK